MIPPRINLDVALIEDKVFESFLNSLEVKPEFYDLQCIGLLKRKNSF